MSRGPRSGASWDRIPESRIHRIAAVAPSTTPNGPIHFGLTENLRDRANRGWELLVAGGRILVGETAGGDGQDDAAGQVAAEQRGVLAAREK